jgi:hypothetical protein
MASLFELWVITITWSIVFLILVSFFLYRKRRTPARLETRAGLKRFVGDFVFVWVLMALLVFYVVTIDAGSDRLFIAGNLAVELFLVYYIMKNKKRS